MQADVAGRPARAGNVLFKRGGDRDYMMRSEKRRGYSGHRGPRRGFDFLQLLYRIFSLILLVVLFPVGVVLVWRRRMGFSGVAKLLTTLTGALLFFIWVAYLLTAPVQDARLADMQRDARGAFIAAQQAITDGATRAGSWTADTVGRAGSNMRALIDHADVIAEVVKWQVRDAAEKGVNAFVPVVAVTATPAPSPSFAPSVAPSPTPSAAAPSPSPSLAPDATIGVFAQATPDTSLPVSAATPTPAASATSPAPTAVNTAPATASAATATPSPNATTAKPTATKNVIAGGTASSAPTAAQATSTVTPAATIKSMATEKATAQPTPDAASAAPTPTSTVDPSLLPKVKPMAEAKVYYFNGSKYYHRAEDCGSMHGAPSHTLGEALEKGKVACPWCDAIPADMVKVDVAVWADQKTKLFHITDECEQLTDDWVAMSLEDALKQGYNPCEECGAYRYVHGLSADATAEPGATTVPNVTTAPNATLAPATTPSGDEIVYVSEKSQYYHKLSSCQGLQGLTPTTLRKALQAGKKPCPACEPVGSP